jgi:hypothetical protein
MPDLTAKRTLVKSPPELWEELSEVDRLAKHLSAFGEITITKLEPEHTVAWEGERASGTVSIEPSGWGTKVTLHAELPEPDEPPEPEPEPEPAAAAEPDSEAQHVEDQIRRFRVEPAQEATVEAPETVAADEVPGQDPTPEQAATTAPEPPADLPSTEARHVPSHSGTLREEHDAEPEAEPVAQASEEAPRRGLWGWLFRKRTEAPAHALIAAEPEPEEMAAGPEPAAAKPEPSEAEPSVPEPSEAEPSVPEPLEPDASEPEPVGHEAAEAEPPADDAEPGPEPKPEPEPGSLDAESGPLDAEPAQSDGPVALDPERALVILDEALDTLGAAHHRPFSRG